MTTGENGIRKVAILISSLDRASADLVLERLVPREAEQVRHAVLELEGVDPSEQRRVIDEFFRAAPGANRLGAGRPAEPAEPGRPPGAAAARGGRTSPMRIFNSLGNMSAEGLAGALSGERPQTIAMVLSHLTPDLAGEVLVVFPPRVQTEILRRLVDLEETDPEILAEIEEELRSRLSQTFVLPRRRVAGLSAVEGILHSAERSVGNRLFRNLSSHDRGLAEQLRPEPIDFDDLERLDASDLEDLLDATDLRLLSLALVGAPPTVIHRVLAALPSSRAKVLRQEMDHPGPTRLSDVESAREGIGRIAQKLGVRPPRRGAGPLAASARADSRFSREV